MIGFIKGNIISAKPTQLLVDVNGVGYICNISINTFEKISNQKSVSLFIHTHVKEDSISLFGFYTEPEKIMFELLISVSGVGPKIALSILSGIQIDDLKNAIIYADSSRISAVPGIGRKTAERLGHGGGDPHRRTHLFRLPGHQHRRPAPAHQLRPRGQ